MLTLAANILALIFIVLTLREAITLFRLLKSYIIFFLVLAFVGLLGLRILSMLSNSGLVQIKTSDWLLIAYFPLWLGVRGVRSSVTKVIAGKSIKWDGKERRRNG